MKFEDIEKMVISKTEISFSASFEETMCFIALRSLYNDFYKNYITKDQAIKERVKLKKQYQHSVWLHNRYTACMAQFQEFIRDAETYRPSILNAIQKRKDVNTVIVLMTECIGSMCHDPVFVKTVKKAMEEIADESIGNNGERIV